MNILIIEDDKIYAKHLCDEICKKFDFRVDVANSLHELEKINIQEYDLVISDIFMEDYDENYIKENIIDKNIPVILMTAFPDKVFREKILKLNVIDFIIKTESNHFTHIIYKLEVLEYLRHRPILIVDDSKTALLINLRLIKKRYPFTQVITAKDGVEGCEKLKECPNIKLILTDYEMPRMDGMQFIQNIRKQYDLDEKIIIALSSVTEKHISSTLLKIGANDFLNKPFAEDELMCRIDNNIKNAILIDEIKELAFRDSLTGLYNRRYFFDIAEKMFLTAQREEEEVSILMCDIDHFKKINDTYGHQTGDLIIKKVSYILENSVRKNDIVARYGGEEFIVFLYDCPVRFAHIIGEKIRKSIEKAEIIDSNDNKIKFTISVGISSKGDNLEEVIKNADSMLYKAKETRNKVVADK